MGKDRLSRQALQVELNTAKCTARTRRNWKDTIRQKSSVWSGK